LEEKEGEDEKENEQREEEEVDRIIFLRTITKDS
jgi:hypothetical protein